MSSNSTGYKAILVGNIGTNIEATPGHLKFVVKYEVSSNTDQTRTDTSKFVRCHVFGKYADVMAHFITPGIKGNFHGTPGNPVVWTLADGTQRSVNTMLVDRIEIHEYQEAKKIAELASQIHDLTAELTKAERTISEQAWQLNKAEDTIATQAAMIANAARIPDEPVQQHIKWHDLPADDLPTIPTGDPEPPALPIIEEEDQGEPMPSF